MNDDSFLTSRTMWASVITVAGTQTEQFKLLPTPMQWGIIAVVCSYILGRSLQKGLEAFAKKT